MDRYNGDKAMIVTDERPPVAPLVVKSGDKALFVTDERSPLAPPVVESGTTGLGSIVLPKEVLYPCPNDGWLNRYHGNR